MENQNHQHHKMTYIRGCKRQRPHSPLYTKSSRFKGEYNDRSNLFYERNPQEGAFQSEMKQDRRIDRNPYSENYRGDDRSDIGSYRFSSRKMSPNFLGEGTSSMKGGDFDFPSSTNFQIASEDSTNYISSVKSRLGNSLNDISNSKRRHDLIVRVKEFVNEEVIVMELSELSGIGHYSPVFVHRSSLYVPKNDNSRRCERLDDVPNGNIFDYFQIGQNYNFEGEETERDCILEWLALKVWPVDYNKPITYYEYDHDQKTHFRKFLNTFDRNNLVFATISTVTGSRMNQVNAHVSKIVTDRFGVIEISGINRGQTLNCLFHYDSIWLVNGQNIVDCVGYTKILSDMVFVGMEVNVSARSIIKFKGQDIVPSKLELQGILVYIKPSAMPPSTPRATRIRGPPGSIGYSRNYTPYFFNSSLLPKLNSQLSEFINITKEVDPLIERSYLNASVDLELLLNNKERRLKRDYAGLQPSVKMDLFASKGIVTVLFDDEDSGVIESTEGGEKCYFHTSNVIIRNEDDFRSYCRIGSILRFNASLIDLHLRIPYLVSTLWNEDFFPLQKHEPNLHRNILERFDCVNKKIGNDLYFPPDALNARGVVYKILDDNFGLIQWDRNHKLILFDTCDLWLDSYSTADKSKKSLKDVIKVNQPLRFHALLMKKDCKIPYLASAVWSCHNYNFTNYPAFVERHQIHAKKVSIYEVVIKSVVEKLFPKENNEGSNKIFTNKNTPMGSTERTLLSNFPNSSISVAGGDIDLPEMVTSSRGRVKHILNENFGLVQDFRSGAYCLFDTYDLYVSPKVSAAESNKSVIDVVKSGDEVSYNATLVNRSKKVPYLVTGLWRVELNDIMHYIHPVRLDSIQSEKINVFDTVSDSCEAILRKCIETKSQKDDVDIRKVIERKKYIQKAYASESYIKYVSSLPKEFRTSRDPRTPEPEYCEEDPTDLIRWREDIVDWLSDKLMRSSYQQQLEISHSDLESDVLDDFNTIGRLYIADDCSDYGIIKLENGFKALLHRERVWLTTRPLGHSTSLKILLWRDQFRTIHVNARKLSPKLQTESGCDYQVIYCHAGTRIPQKAMQFDYSHKMVNWINALKSNTILDKELDTYIQYHLDTNKNK